MQLAYRFGNGTADGDVSMRDLLGGKGANLAHMSRLGLPVPPGITIPTTVCVDYMAADTATRTEMVELLVDRVVMPHLNDIAKDRGVFPLWSVRSGARVSIPGMMDTILNVGLTPDRILEWGGYIGLAAAQDCYRRLMEMWVEVVVGAELLVGPDILHQELELHGETSFMALPEQSRWNVLQAYDEDLVNLGTGIPDVREQMVRSIHAVLMSWNSDRARAFRAEHGYSDDWGTAVNIQMMVFGNRDDQSCSGVMFTRNPETGEPELYGDYVLGQGEDVVSGKHSTLPLSHLAKDSPDIYQRLREVACLLEIEYRDAQDVEWTVESGDLYILQTRSAMRSAPAAFRIAWDLYQENAISLADASERVSGELLEATLRDTVSPAFEGTEDALGLAGGGGVVSGAAAFTPVRAQKMAQNGRVILIRPQTLPEDYAGMVAASGILTSTGGLTSHAAVVARGMNTPCVVSCAGLEVKHNHCLIAGKKVCEGDLVTIDGATGRVWKGQINMSPGMGDPYADKMLEALYQGEPWVAEGTLPRDALGNLLVFPVREFDSVLATGEFKDLAAAVARFGYNGGDFSRTIFDVTPCSSNYTAVDSAFYEFVGGCRNDVMEAAALAYALVRAVKMLGYPPESIMITAEEWQEKAVRQAAKGTTFVPRTLEPRRKIRMAYELFGGEWWLS